MLTFKMSEAQAVNIHNMAKSHIGTLKNHIAMYVESGKIEDATKLVGELREHEAIFAAFNREASHFIATSTGKPLEKTRTVADRSR